MTNRIRMAFIEVAAVAVVAAIFCWMLTLPKGNIDPSTVTSLELIQGGLINQAWYDGKYVHVRFAADGRERKCTKNTVTLALKPVATTTIYYICYNDSTKAVGMTVCLPKTDYWQIRWAWWKPAWQKPDLMVRFAP